MRRFKFSQIHMGVLVTITVYTSESVAVGACRAAFERFAELDDVMSDYRTSSELMRLCGLSGRGPQRVSSDLCAVLNQAQEFAEISHGALDVTCGPLSVLWRTARSTGALPRLDEVEEARKLVGFRNLIVDRRASTAELTLPGMRLDLGGIGKGYACDEALIVLKQHGIESAMLEAGGDIALSSPPPEKQGWTIAIADTSSGRASPANLTLSNCGISTSGDAEQVLVADGVHHSHLFDPRTGEPLKDQPQITITAPTAMISDGLTKICCVLGLEASKSILDCYNGRAREHEI